MTRVLKYMAKVLFQAVEISQSPKYIFQQCIENPNNNALLKLLMHLNKK